MAVAIDGNPGLKPAVATVLFTMRVGRYSEVTWDYVAAPDGQRFLYKELGFEEGGSPLVVVLNWQGLLSR